MSSRVCTMVGGLDLAVLLLPAHCNATHRNTFSALSYKKDATGETCLSTPLTSEGVDNLWASIVPSFGTPSDMVTAFVG